MISDQITRAAKDLARRARAVILSGASADFGMITNRNTREAKDLYAIS
jgi:hypothetical protein